MKKETGVVEALALIFLVAVSVTVGYTAGKIYADRAFAKEAIQRGYAEWRVNENGQPSFHWKESRP